MLINIKKVININKKIIYLILSLILTLFLINACSLFRDIKPIKPMVETYSLNVVLAGDGVGAVINNLMGIDCGEDCTQNYNTGTEVVLTATASTGSIFSSWTGCNIVNGDTCTVTINTAKTVTATFNLISTNTYTLTVTKIGTGFGDVISDITGVDCGIDCTEDYNENTQVTLTAIASSDSTFAGWSNGCTGTSTCIITLDSNITVTATFNLITTSNTTSNYTLDITKSGTGTGTITGTGIDCGTDCSESYTSGTQVILTASASSDSTFTSWGGICLGVSTTSTCTITMSSDQEATATFDLISTLTSCTPPICNPNNNLQYCSNNQWADCSINQACSNGACVTTIVPASPSNLQASLTNENYVTLTWQDNSDNEDGFKIERLRKNIITGQVTGTWEQIATVNTGVITYTDTTVAQGFQYQYKVRAYNNIGDSAYSNTVTITIQTS